MDEEDRPYIYQFSDELLLAFGIRSLLVDPNDYDPFADVFKDAPTPEIATYWRNAVSAYWHALGKDSPGKVWWDAEYCHPAIYRALKVDRSDPVASYACAPFRLGKIDEKHVILCAWPPLPNLSECRDWLSIDQVIVWHPKENTASILGDINPQVVGAFPDTDTGTIFASPFAFFRALIEERASFATAYQASKKAHWQTAPSEKFTPGVLMVGDPDKIRWRLSDLPPVIECVGIDPAKVNKAIFKSARLPRCTSSMKAAA
jgi:hypothetical protein